MTDGVLAAIGAIGLLAGLVGTVVPVVPGLVVVLLATAGTLLAQGASGVVWAVVAVLVVMAVAGTAASTVLPARRAAASGAPRRSLALAAAGALVGFFVIPVAGMVLGGALGLLLAERDRLGEWDPAWVSTRSVLTGYGLGVLVELSIGVVMGIVWAVTFVLRA